MSEDDADAGSWMVVAGGKSEGLFDTACNHVKEMTQARCVAVIVMDGEDGCGYSVIGPLEAQMLLPDILEQIAVALRQQLTKNLQ